MTSFIIDEISRSVKVEILSGYSSLSPTSPSLPKPKQKKFSRSDWKQHVSCNLIYEIKHLASKHWNEWTNPEPVILGDFKHIVEYAIFIWVKDVIINTFDQKTTNCQILSLIGFEPLLL